MTWWDKHGRAVSSFRSSPTTSHAKKCFRYDAECEAFAYRKRCNGVAIIAALMVKSGCMVVRDRGETEGK